MEFFVKNNWTLQRNRKCSSDSKSVHLRSRICKMNDLRLLQYSWTPSIFVPLYKDIFPSCEYKPRYWIIQIWAYMSTHGEVPMTTVSATYMLNCSGFFFCACKMLLYDLFKSFQTVLSSKILHFPSYWKRMVIYISWKHFRLSSALAILLG